MLHCNEVDLVTGMRLDKYAGNQIVPIDETDTHVSTIQAPGITYVRNIRVNINGKEMHNSNSMFSFKAYSDLELGCSREIKKTQLGAIGYFPSTTRTVTWTPGIKHARACSPMGPWWSLSLG